MHGHIKRNEIKQEYEAVSGTMPLNCSIKDLFSIINAGAKVISGPGGLATILAFTSSDILVLQKKLSLMLVPLTQHIEEKMDILRYGRGSKTRYSMAFEFERVFFR